MRSQHEQNYRKGCDSRGFTTMGFELCGTVIAITVVLCFMKLSEARVAGKRMGSMQRTNILCSWGKELRRR